ncbi:MAG: M48 family metalloprotease [Cyanobacteria bacterium P01_F01_bin.86]
MSELYPPSSKAFPSSENSPEESLQQGLNALKRKDYPTAIRILSKLPQNFSASGAVRLKARLGLVRALKGNGQIAEAIALCQTLENHSQAKIQQWATTTLSQLRAHGQSTAEGKTSDQSGFQPLEPSGDPAETAANANQPTLGADAADQSGFQPLAAPSNPIQPSEFVFIASEASPSSETIPNVPPLSQERQDPIDTPAATPATPADPLATDAVTPDQLETSSPPTAEPPVTANVSAATANAATDGDPESPQTSLFHYEHLNKQATPTEQPLEETVPAQELESGAIGEQATAATDAAPTVQSWQLRYAGRLQRLRSLPQSKGTLIKIGGMQICTLIALFWVSRAFVRGTLSLLAEVLRSFKWLVSIPVGWQYRSQTFSVFLVLGILLLASPWLLDWLLNRAYRQKTLSLQKLKQTHPEGCRLLRRIAQQRGSLIPVLRELPTDAPLIFSYGWLPRYNRIVISRGLLKRLDDGEFATLIGYELAHFTTWTAPVMSLVGSLLLLLHQGYWQMAKWGDRQTNRWAKTIAAALSALSYTLYWVVRKITIPLSRVRVHFSDRQAVAWTGNPNALVRALLKLEAGLAETLSLAGHTPPLVESTDLLTPNGYETAISIGSVYPDPAFLKALQWDTHNPYRHWLACNRSHPLLGERLKQLTGQALQWQLDPELLPEEIAVGSTLQTQVTFRDYWLPFLQQISPYISPVVGIVVAMLLWFVGGLFNPLGVWQVSWLYGDQSLLRGSVLIGVGIGIALRINRYFPDINMANRQKNPFLPRLLTNPMALPTDSRPVRLQGILLGRQGMANWLCQDLILKTPTGLLKLHFLSSLGAFGNLFMHPQHPTNWVGRSLDVQGWFRRGAIAWIDIDQLLKSGKVIARSNHPIWSVLLSLTFCALGIYTLFRGQ